MVLRGIVLVEPEHPANLGLIARGMVCFGIKDLVIIGNPDENFLKKAKRISKQGIEVLENVRFFESLDQLRDYFLVGTISPYDAERNGISGLVPVWDLKELREEFYIVFGREGSGLRKEELEICDLISTIPTNGKKGVLNLAMAVTIYLYELTKGRILEFCYSRNL